MGELFQNNHHHAKNNANFARKWYEFDPTYMVMRIMNFVGIIKLKKLAAVLPMEENVNDNMMQRKKVASY